MCECVTSDNCKFEDKKNIHTNLRSMNDNMKSIAGKRNKKNNTQNERLTKKQMNRVHFV